MSRDEIHPVPRPSGLDLSADLERADLPEHARRQEVQDLVGRAHAGDVEALNELFARYHSSMVEFARRRLGPRLRTKEEADDLAQTTFREATRDFSRYQYRGEDSLLRWLAQILQNKIRDKAEYYTATKRDVSRERTAEEGVPDVHESAPHERSVDDLSVTRHVRRKEEFAILREALHNLSPDHRKAITLVFFEGLSLRAAGERMEGRSEDAVRMLLRRAESHLRELTRNRLTSG
jgi:RNA polymerase sigma-70 factor (ECF subfamily)